jgi:hypothetical protein
MEDLLLLICLHIHCPYATEEYVTVQSCIYFSRILSSLEESDSVMEFQVVTHVVLCNFQFDSDNL